jgi:adenylate cyclase
VRERARRKRPDNLDAYDLYLRALPHTHPAMPDNAAIAIGYLDQALALDPDYAPVHAALAVNHETRFRSAGFDEAERRRAVHHARLALALGTDDANALALAALTVLHVDRDFAAASGAITRALSLNASCATALYIGAHIHAVSGDLAVAEDYAERALRLSPFDPFSFEAHLAVAIVRVRQRRYDEAVAYGTKAIQANPRFSVLYGLQAMTLALAGRIDEAKTIARRVLELEPGFRVQPMLEFAGFLDPEMREAFARGLRQAGLPE